MVKVFISIGSNLGDRLRNIKSAIKELNKGFDKVKVSKIYETSPLINKNQPYFLNCVASIETFLSPHQLLRKLKSIEEEIGRKKSKKYAPRIIDLDILFYGKEVYNSQELKIPHPEIQNRKFVLKPMCDLEPNFIHPVLKKSVYKLLSDLKNKNQKIKIYRQ